MEQATMPRPEEITKMTQSNALAAIVPQIMNAIGGGDQKTQSLLMQQQQQNNIQMEKQKEQMFMRSIMSPDTGEINPELIQQNAVLYDVDPSKVMKLFMTFDAFKKKKAEAQKQKDIYDLGLEVATIPGVNKDNISSVLSSYNNDFAGMGLDSEVIMKGTELAKGLMPEKEKKEKPTILPDGSMLIGKDNKVIIENKKDVSKKSKDYAPVQLTKLYNELDSLPEGDPRRKAYQTRIDQLLTGGNPDLETILAQRIVDGKLDFNKLSRRGKQKGRVAAIIAQIDPDFDLIKADANIKYKTDSSNLRSIALINGVQPLFDKLISKAEELNNSRIKLTNRAINFAKLQTGDPKLVAFNNLRDDVIAETERILMGSGVLSDSKYLRALENLNSAQSPKQMKAAIEQMMFVVKKREAALLEEPYPQTQSSQTDISKMTDQQLLEALQNAQ